MKPKYQTPEEIAKFLHDNGLIFELNRQFLHPRGLALSVVEEKDGTISGFGPIFETEDPAGIVFGDELWEEGEAKFKAFSKDEGYMAQRIAKYGIVAQRGKL